VPLTLLSGETDIVNYKQIIRTNPQSSRTERPWRNRDHFFVLADPTKGAVRHHDEHAVKVDNYGEALELVELGYPIRMSDGKSAPSLVSPASLCLLDEEADHLDELWTYSMPDVPFTREALELDVRGALLSKAAEIYWLAGPATANSFIGFELDVDEVDQGTQAADIRLDRFNFARVIFAAYDSAYRTGAAKLISEEDVDELELMIGALFSAGARRYPSPADDPGSPLRRTMLSAYFRWKLSEGYLFGHKLDQSAVESLAVLAGMSEQAVRNSLSRGGLSPVKNKLDYAGTISWLQNRREFVPLRESERPEARPTWDAIHLFKTLPIAEALASVRSRQQPRDPASLKRYESELLRAVGSGEDPQPEALRNYARNLNLSIDTFVVEFLRTVAAARK
jgi:hypothetical protein